MTTFPYGSDGATGQLPMEADGARQPAREAGWRLLKVSDPSH